MNNIKVRPAQTSEFGPIARLIVGQNKDPKTHCIHSDTAETYEGVLREIMALAANSEICFVVAFQGEQLIGTLGCELDEETGRGWLRGPFVVADNWHKVAAALRQELFSVLPPAIRWVDSFLNVANERGNNFYLASFRQLRLVHVYIAHPPAKPVVLSSLCPVLSPEQGRSFVILHNTIFSQTYATGERILNKLNDDHRVFVYTDNDELLGYLYVEIEEAAQEGMVNFLGVRLDARRQGIAQKLLQTALHWIFEIKKMPQAALVVNDNLTNARRLYEKVGFNLKYTGVHTRKEW